MADPSHIALPRVPLVLGGLVLLAVVGLAPFDMAQSAQGVPTAISLQDASCMGPAKTTQPGRATCPMEARDHPSEASADFLIALMFRP